MNLLLELRIATVLYELVGVFAVVRLLKPNLLPERIVPMGLAIASLFHLVVLFHQARVLHGFPIVDMHGGLSVFALVVALTTALVGWKSRVPQLAPLGAIATALIIGVAQLNEPALDLPMRLQSPWLPLHIATAFLGNALFMAAGLVAVLYLVQERRLKQKKRSSRSRLPPLEVLDQLSLRMIQVGFPLLTLAIISGWLLGTGRGSPAASARLLSVHIVWLLYAVLLHFRLWIGWRGRRLAWLTVFGLVAAIVSVGLNVTRAKIQSGRGPEVSLRLEPPSPRGSPGADEQRSDGEAQ